jgi:ribosomal protein S18 acetylase RimI-like enzyme
MTSADIRVRRALHTDWSAVAAIADEFMALHHEWHPSRFRRALIGFTPALFQTWLTEPEALNLAAELKGEVVGYARAWRSGGFSNEFIFPRRGVHVGLLMVASRVHRRGVGRALLCAVEAGAAEFGAEVVGLDMSPHNERGRAFYAALGYELSNEYRVKTLRKVRRFESEI